MLVEPILAAFPAAKVGGPAMAHGDSPTLPEFIELCRETNTQLDFISWHRYSDKLESYRTTTTKIQGYLADFPHPKPEIMLNEWNKGFDFDDPDNHSYHLISVEEMALSARRAAFTATNLLNMMETGLDWSHDFLLWDSCCYPEQFASFYSPESIRRVMYKHWNETGHRFGLFSEGGAVRPQYFVYQMLSRMGDRKVATTCEAADVHARAVADDGKLSVLLANYDPDASRDMIVTVNFANLQPGVRALAARRIDDDQRWSSDDLELIPIEERTVSVLSEFLYQFYLPADSVLLVTLEERP